MSGSTAIPRFTRSLVTGLLLVGLLSACDDNGLQLVDDRSSEVAVVVNSVDVSITVFPTEDPGAVGETIGLGPAGSPTGLSIHEELAVVPLGFVPAVAVVDVETGELLRTVALPEGSGATGSAFLNDSIALVANSNLNTVSAVNVLTGTVAPEIPVGGFPQAVVVSEERAVVVNGELGPDFLPAGPATLTVLDRESLAFVATIELTGSNAGSAAVGVDGRLYVVNSGRFGLQEGSVSVVDLVAGEEVEHHEGFGDFPVGAVFDPAGRLHISAFSFGIAVWDPDTEAFVRSPEAAVAPEGTASVSGVGVDSEGRLYALRPDCAAPSAALRLDSDYQVEALFPVGICPFAIAFTEVEG